MGILNVTPDSFYAGSRVPATDALLTQAEQMLAEGAAILDVGAYSSRPGADDIAVEEEKRRLLPALQALRKAFPQAILSADTFRAAVAEPALKAGADLVNDISGGTLDARMEGLIAEARVPYIMMHMRGTPQTMTTLTQYDDLIAELLAFFHARVARLQARGVADIVLDPGLGFAKNVAQNYELLEQLPLLRILSRPLLVGLSRKSMIWRRLGTSPAEALNGTTALHVLALQGGARILRVHDVRPAREVIDLMYPPEPADPPDPSSHT